MQRPRNTLMPLFLVCCCYHSSIPQRSTTTVEAFSYQHTSLTSSRSNSQRMPLSSRRKSSQQTISILSEFRDRTRSSSTIVLYTEGSSDNENINITASAKGTLIKRTTALLVTAVSVWMIWYYRQNLLAMHHSFQTKILPHWLERAQSAGWTGSVSYTHLTLPTKA